MVFGERLNLEVRTPDTGVYCFYFVIIVIQFLAEVSGNKK